MPEILTVGEAADYLRLSQRKLYSLVQERRVPVARLDGRLLFPRRLLDAWLLEHVEGPRPVERPPPVLAGSHDPLLEWAARESGCGLALLTGGSGDGLRRLQHGQAVAAGTHLREPGGSYNLASLAGLGIRDIVLVAWAVRRQGLILPQGNPRAISMIADLAGGACRVARRQEGSGGEVLLAFLMSEAGLTAPTITWLEQPCRTDTDLAHAVLDGLADAGLAIESVARRFRLDFIPLAEERFDLALRRRDFFEPPFQALLDFARSAPFRERAAELGGYDVTELGRIRLNGI
jgi:putative molybdopterin biosynthesis protein